MKEYFLTVFLVLVVGTCHTLAREPEKDAELVIAILQTSAHPALDIVRESFKKQLSQQISRTLQYIEYNGMGQINALQSMANRICANSNVQLTLAIGTSALQVMARSDRERPIVYAAVTDPKILSLDGHDNICGVSDRVKAISQIRTLTGFLPEVESISIIYNPTESNSQSAVSELMQVCSMHHIEVTLCGASTVAEIPAAVNLACQHGDVIFAPADNLVAMTMPIITEYAQKQGKGVFAAYPVAVDQGAVLSFGVNYIDVGNEAAHQAYHILVSGISPIDLGCRYLKGSERVNILKCERIGLKISKKNP